MESFIELLTALYGIPSALVAEGHRYQNWLLIYVCMAGVATIAIWGVTIALLTPFARIALNKWRYYARRGRCQHCRQWTIKLFTDPFEGCDATKPCCDTCWPSHQVGEAKRTRELHTGK